MIFQILGIGTGLISGLLLFLLSGGAVIIAYKRKKWKRRIKPLLIYSAVIGLLYGLAAFGMYLLTGDFLIAFFAVIFGSIVAFIIEFAFGLFTMFIADLLLFKFINKIT